MNNRCGVKCHCDMLFIKTSSTLYQEIVWKQKQTLTDPEGQFVKITEAPEIFQRNVEIENKKKLIQNKFIKLLYITTSIWKIDVKKWKYVHHT